MGSKGVFRHRFELENREGFVTNNLHNWDGKSFDTWGYPLSDCNKRLYPKFIGYQNKPGVKPTMCKECFSG